MREVVLRYPVLWELRGRRAHALLNSAVRCGCVVKPDACSRCGVVGVSIAGHHPDYDLPFDVDWFCQPCHSAEHRRKVRCHQGHLYDPEPRAGDWDCPDCEKEGTRG